MGARVRGYYRLCRGLAQELHVLNLTGQAERSIELDVQYPTNCLVQVSTDPNFGSVVNAGSHGFQLQSERELHSDRKSSLRKYLSEPAPFNAAAPYRYAWPTSRARVNRNTWFTDPLTGIAENMFSAPVPVNGGYANGTVQCGVFVCAQGDLLDDTHNDGEMFRVVASRVRVSSKYCEPTQLPRLAQARSKGSRAHQFAGRPYRSLEPENAVLRKFRCC
jgi:hypothetical protein